MAFEIRKLRHSPNRNSIAMIWAVTVTLILHQVSGGEEAKEKIRKLRPEYPVPVVVRVPTETAEVYECLHGGDSENVNYTWYRPDWPSLPIGTEVEGNKLYFTHSTSDLNGLYGCMVINERGTSIAYLYRDVQECFLNWIIKILLDLWVLPPFLFLQ